MNKNPKCPTCNGVMVGSYDSSMFGKDYWWRCSKKKNNNPTCHDKDKYFECEKHSKICCEICKTKGEK